MDGLRIFIHFHGWRSYLYTGMPWTQVYKYLWRSHFWYFWPHNEVELSKYGRSLFNCLRNHHWSRANCVYVPTNSGTGLQSCTIPTCFKFWWSWSLCWPVIPEHLISLFLFKEPRDLYNLSPSYWHLEAYSPIKYSLTTSWQHFPQTSPRGSQET